jgi:hypothetical protein
MYIEAICKTRKDIGYLTAVLQENRYVTSEAGGGSSGAGRSCTHVIHH